MQTDYDSILSIPFSNLVQLPTRDKYSSSSQLRKIISGTYEKDPRIRELKFLAPTIVSITIKSHYSEISQRHLTFGVRINEDTGFGSIYSESTILQKILLSKNGSYYWKYTLEDLGLEYETFGSILQTFDELYVNTNRDIDGYIEFLKKDEEKYLDVAPEIQIPPLSATVNIRRFTKILVLLWKKAHPGSLRELMIILNTYINYFREKGKLTEYDTEPTEPILKEMYNYINTNRLLLNRNEKSSYLSLRNRIKEANQEYQILVDGLKLSLADKYNISEDYITEGIYKPDSTDFNNRKIDTLLKTKKRKVT